MIQNSQRDEHKHLNCQDGNYIPLGPSVRPRDDLDQAHKLHVVAIAAVVH
jgi:hypothetical protein